MATKIIKGLTLEGESTSLGASSPWPCDNRPVEGKHKKSWVSNINKKLIWPLWLAKQLVVPHGKVFIIVYPPFMPCGVVRWWLWIQSGPDLDSSPS
jgi:hypothetical protein